MKTKVLIYTLCKERIEIYTDIHCPFVFKSCCIALVRIKIILLSDKVVIVFKAGSRTGVKERHIKLTFAAGTYSINNFNAKVKAAVLKPKQD